MEAPFSPRELRRAGADRPPPIPAKVTPRAPARLPLLVLLPVAGMALAIEGFMLSSSRLWVATDSVGYIHLAAAIAENFDFSHPFFQYRAPGYPTFLATIFVLFGDASPQAILVIQHAMVAGIAVLGASLAWALWPHRAFALMAGLLGALSLHLSVYANTIMTEVPYTFLLTTCLWLLVCYDADGKRRWLMGASVAAGLCAVIRSTGQILPILCVMVALHRMWITRRQPGLMKRGGWLRSTGVALLAATAPAAVFILPVMMNSYRATGLVQLTCAYPYHLYYRAVVLEKLDSDSSAAMTRVRETLEEAKRRALISPSVELSQPWGVAAAFKAVHGMSLADAAEVMGQAGRDLIIENPGLILRQSVRDCYRTMFMPDSYYRVVPGETPPEMFDMDEAIAGVTRFAGPTTMEKYLPMDRRPTLTSPLRGRITRWYRRHIEKGSSVVGLLDTPYEEFMLFCLLGGLLSLRCPNRMFWIMLGVVVFAHVVCSAFLGGLHPRYAVPVHPLLHIFGAFALIRCVQVARWVPRAAVSLYVGRRMKPARSP